MPPETDEADRVRLTHMLWAARQARDFAIGRGRRDLDDDPMFARATVHCIQEIGEAASKVGESTRAAIPSVPWRQIVGMRHQLVHVYFRLNYDLIWHVITEDREPLLDALELFLPDAPDEPKEAR